MPDLPISNPYLPANHQDAGADLICPECGRNLTEESNEEDWLECFNMCIDCVADGIPSVADFERCKDD